LLKGFLKDPGSELLRRLLKLVLLLEPELQSKKKGTAWR
jgi:hypothetical protein